MCWILPLLFSTWIGLALLLLGWAGDKLPVPITNVLSLAHLPFIPLIPLLKPFGFVTGEYGYSTPTAVGFLLSIALYDIVLYIVGRLFR